MSFNVYFSNKVEKLASSFSNNISSDRELFKPTFIASQAPGTQSWLKAELADRLGVLSNFVFLKSSDIINKVMFLADCSLDKFFSVDRLKWIVSSLLDEKAFKDEFSQVADYYGDDAFKRIQLADKVAELFGQYMLFRLDYIDCWNNNTNVEFLDDNLKDEFDNQQQWQSYLWKRIRDIDQSVDSFSLKDKLLSNLKDDSYRNSISSYFKNITLFGFSTLPVFYLDIFVALADFIDLNLYIVSPSKDFLSDGLGETENDLFKSLAGLNIEFSTLLNTIDKDVIHCQSSFDNIKSDTLLGTLQEDIFNANNAAIESLEYNEKSDTSLQIASSYTAIREIEALYNYLIESFSKDDSLKASDVLVKLTSVDEYAPLIRVVFDNAPYKIPYVVVDETEESPNSLISALNKIIDFSEDDFTSENLIQFLEIPIIRNKFDISDLDAVRQMIRDANIRQAISGRHEDDTNTISWTYGLERLLLGYAIKGGERYESKDNVLFPVDTIEGSSAYEMLRLKSFVDTFISVFRSRTSSKSIHGWKDFIINDVISSLFELDEEHNEEFSYVVNKMNFIEQGDELFNEEIDFKVFTESLNFRTFSESKQWELNTGRLTFCSMSTLHCVPAKIVAVLGLDANKYPSKTQALGFDLMNFENRIGDIKPKTNDRYLFLEAILSARESLYLSYIGRSIKDNGVAPPTLLIDDLVDYVEINDNINKSSIITEHSLHSFSSLYNHDDSKYYSYLNNTSPSLEMAESKIIEPAKYDLSRISLSDLISFCKNPFKYYYNKVLNIYYNEDETLLPEYEMIGLDPLSRFVVKTDAMAIKDDDIEDYIERACMTGSLPLANMGGITFRDELKAIERLRGRFFDMTDSIEQKSFKISLDISLDDRDCTLDANIHSIYNGVFIFPSVSSSSSIHKQYIEVWIKHLVLTASGKNIRSLLLSNKENDELELKPDMIGVLAARERLCDLISMFVKGHEEIIPFMPRQGYKDQKDKKDSKKEMLNIKSEGETNSRKTWKDEYIAKEVDFGYFYGRLDDKVSSFVSLSELLFSDIVNL